MCMCVCVGGSVRGFVVVVFGLVGFRCCLFGRNMIRFEFWENGLGIYEQDEMKVGEVGGRVNSLDIMKV